MKLILKPRTDPENKSISYPFNGHQAKSRCFILMRPEYWRLGLNSSIRVLAAYRRLWRCYAFNWEGRLETSHEINNQTSKE